MSAICVFTPIVVHAAWPTVTALAASALGALGYARIAVSGEAGTREKTGSSSGEVELALEQAGELEGSLGEEDSVSFQREDMTLTFRKTAEGRLKVCVRGGSGSPAELRAAGHEAVRKFLQAYGRERISAELKKRGFTLEEEKLPDGTIRIKARGWS